MTVLCRYHCSPCGRHFHSLKAFDAHHARHESGWPVCLGSVDLEERAGRSVLEALTTRGECRMYAEVQTGCTIWILAGSREQAARNLRDAAESRRRGARRRFDAKPDLDLVLDVSATNKGDAANE